ncbi:hypothetical protein Trydic_g10009, partial [Trypoxylus dichotomus]
VPCPDNRRGADDLMPIIQQYVAAGTEIHTVAWRSYRGLMDCGTGCSHVEDCYQTFFTGKFRRPPSRMVMA